MTNAEVVVRLRESEVQINDSAAIIDRKIHGVQRSLPSGSQAHVALTAARLHLELLRSQCTHLAGALVNSVISTESSEAPRGE